MLRAATLALMKREFGATTYLSVEPLLEEVEIASLLSFIDFVIIGCESGPGMRPFEDAWARRIVHGSDPSPVDRGGTFGAW